RLAGDLPVLWVLERNVSGRLELRGRSGDLAVGCRPASGLVRDDAVFSDTLRCRHAPLVGRSLNQHHARGCAAFAHVLLRLPDATAATGRHVTPGPLPGEVLSWCRILRLDLAPVALELFSYELGKARQGPLPHFRP